MRLLAQLFRTNAGAAVRITPKIFDTVRMIPDLQVIRAEGDLFVDVVVSHPAAPSRGTTRALAVSGYASKAKHKRYGEMVEARGAQLLAFAVDSFGAFSKEAMEVVKSLRAGADGSIFRTLSSSTAGSPVSLLAICLQKGNAYVMKKGALESRLQAAKWGGLTISPATPISANKS